MEQNELLQELRSGIPVQGGSEGHRIMIQMSRDAFKVTSVLNQGYHEPDEIRRLMGQLTGSEIDDSFCLFPPLYTECGKNLFIGKRVFINMCCHFQDQGGIYIGNDVLIGSYVVMATINHDLDPANRSCNIPRGIHIGNKVWIGSHATILPGVTVGDRAVVAAGAVVTKDVPPDTVVAGVPAVVIKKIRETDGA